MSDQAPALHVNRRAVTTAGGIRYETLCGLSLAASAAHTGLEHQLAVRPELATCQECRELALEAWGHDGSRFGEPAASSSPGA